jgi:hypothetical protein
VRWSEHARPGDDGDGWWVVLNPAGRVVAVEGGAPTRWIGAHAATCDGMDEALRRALVAIARQPLEATQSGARHLRVDELADRPPVDVLVVEGVWLLPQEVALSTLVEQATRPFAEEAASQGVQLEVAVEDEGARVVVDEEKIAWSIGALVVGALRHVRRGSGAMPGGRVVVRVSIDEPQAIARIVVEDDGCGIDHDKQQALLVRGSPGRGHTLRLVQEIAEAHGGGLVVRSSTDPGDRGTTTTLVLPLAP